MFCTLIHSAKQVIYQLTSFENFSSNYFGTITLAIFPSIYSSQTL